MMSLMDCGRCLLGHDSDSAEWDFPVPTIEDAPFPILPFPFSKLSVFGFGYLTASTAEPTKQQGLRLQLLRMFNFHNSVRLKHQERKPPHFELFKSQRCTWNEFEFVMKEEKHNYLFQLTLTFHRYRRHRWLRRGFCLLWLSFSDHVK